MKRTTLHSKIGQVWRFRERKIEGTMTNAIETNRLTRKFGDRVAVADLSLAIPEGSVFGFLGPNGAGKTTTVRMLSALISPTSGEAVVAGHRLGAENDAIRRSVGILTETPGLYDRLSAWENLLFFARLYDVEAKLAANQVERYLRQLELWDRKNDKVGGFSKGMRQKLAIARALLHEPPVVFLDEPTSGLDPEAARMVRDYVKTLRSEGRTIFLTTHNLEEADELCDQIGVFKTNLIRTDSPEHLREGLFGRGVEVHLTADAAPFVETVRGLPFVRQVAAKDSILTIALDDPDAQSPDIMQALIASGAKVRTMKPVDHSLEEVYMQLIGKNGKTNEVQP
jgi:ABC-2 type transport system ATP-binding protein